MVDDTAEPRRRRLKRMGRAWPRWLRSEHIIRWLIILGPHIYRLWKMVHSIVRPEDG